MGGQIRVIIADDHTLVREGTRQLLERQEDIEVVGEAADGREAIALAERLSPHVAILDIAMPVKNGIEATTEIKSLRPEVAILVLTVHDEDQYLFALLEAGAAGYLLKDVDAGELIAAVRAVHAGESVLHPVIVGKVLDHFRAAGASPGDQTGLTDRELEVLELAAGGRSNKQIAHELDVSVRTIQAHLGHIFTKLGVASRTEAVIHALRRGWFNLEELA